jgi:hypothetical protein
MTSTPRTALRNFSLLLGLLGIAAAALAQPLPPASSVYFQYSDIAGQWEFGWSATTIVVPDGSGAFYQSGDALGGTDPSVDATTAESVLAPSSDYTSAADGSGLFYSLEVEGPTSVVVPLDIVGSFSGSWSSSLDNAGDSAWVFGDYQINDADYNYYVNDELSQPADPTGGQTESLDQTIELQSNTVYTVGLVAQTSLDLSNLYGDNPIPGGYYSITASVDPTITIDPSFLLPGYSLDVSPNLLTINVPDSADTLGLIALSLSALLVLKAKRLSLRPASSAVRTSR